MSATKPILISALERESIQPRAATSEETVARYAEQMTLNAEGQVVTPTGELWPFVVVFQDGQGRLWRARRRAAHKTRCKMTDKRSELVLTRKVGDVVVIELPDGREIEIEVRELRTRQVRLAVLADRQIVIRRAELAARDEVA